MPEWGCPPDLAVFGRDMHSLCARLYPLNRSITGDGVRRTLASLREHVPLEMHEVRSGTSVFDWTVPLEWAVSNAYIEDEDGRRVVDLHEHTLHLVSYSEPVHARMTLEELQPHLHSLPDRPDWIPYRTSYYNRGWGFCLTHAQRAALRPGIYKVVIDSRLEPGHLTYGEYVVRGDTSDEVLVSTHVCHPSLANDNLSGIVVATFLARQLTATARRPRYTYRFLFIPGTIGAITWLALNEDRLSNIVAGLVLSGVGDRGPLNYKRSRRGDSTMDRVCALLLAQRGGNTLPFTPYGYDERQYCSPGIDLPVGCLMRTPFGDYPEYHTSADNLDFILPDKLESTFRFCLDVFDHLERVRTYRNLSPKCEPQLGRRGLYDATGGESEKKRKQLALLWMLNYSDGRHSTLDICELSGLDLKVLDDAARRLLDAGLLEMVN